MNTKQKAAILVLSYLGIVSNNMSTAKQCALVAINEQIKLYNEFNILGWLPPNSVGFELAEIKAEIEKI